ncbi:penicillin-binding transpeptidase domain-containing protein [Pseudonocardia sp. ICBG601]|uniref:penicillin-binding transpeptidase domain-containing protein n=1 Tax=Pseudonocardia sp. ICBG601 TaxID=2846759 RepID=UPI0027E278C4|nr:penicillin-binding transpeptidase domain-containing protein [Pseudonocardia sp. ICBG601]
MLVVMVLLVSGLIATLWLSTAAAADSYSLQAARERTASLTEQSEALRKEVTVLQSPGSLADRAAAQGMVRVTDPARLVVAPDGRVDVVGEPMAAVAAAPAVPPVPPAADAPAPQTPPAPPAGQPGAATTDPAAEGGDAAPGGAAGAGQGAGQDAGQGAGEGTEREVPADTRAAGGKLMVYAPPRPRPRGQGPRGGRRRSPADDPRFRLRLAWVALAALLLVSGAKLVVVQTVQAGTLTADAEKQRASRIVVPAERGSITDRNGAVLAFSTESKALVTNPRLINSTKGADAVAYKNRMAEAVAAVTHGDPEELKRALNSDRGYVVMATAVDPGPARDLRRQFPEIAEESREARQYPNGTLASNIIGAATWSADAQKLIGRIGLESSDDALLAGRDGFQIADTAEGSGTVIPGSVRSEQAAVSGSDVQLTIDSDLQFQVQRMLADYAGRAEARSGSAVVLDRATGQVLALADNTSFDPAQLLSADPNTLGNKGVTTPFEPGSVNKVVTMAAALEAGVAKPDDVLAVPAASRSPTGRSRTPGSTASTTTR